MTGFIEALIHATCNSCYYMNYIKHISNHCSRVWYLLSLLFSRYHLNSDLISPYNPWISSVDPSCTSDVSKGNHQAEPRCRVQRSAGRRTTVSPLSQRLRRASPAPCPLFLHQLLPPAPQQTSYRMWLIAVIWTGAIKQITWIIAGISLINTWLASN